MKKKTLYLLFCIVLLGTILRFWRLGDVPVGFHRDEAFLVYNGWSILHTGKDLNGIVLPLHLKSFLYSPAGYSYASIPPLFLFGLTPFSARFASAFFGASTILLTYFFVLELFSSSKLRSTIALLSSLILAISPWHINLSRTATENTIVVFFMILGIYLYFVWVKNNSARILLASFVSFALTLITYQAPRAFLPLFIPFLFLFSKRPAKKLVLPTFLYTLLILIPIFLILSSSALSTRISTLSIAQNGDTRLIIDEKIREDGSSGVPLLPTRALHNKLFGLKDSFLENYFAHFSYPFLFTDNVLPIRYKVPGASLLYLVELPLLLLGMWSLYKNHKKIALLIFGWVLLVPVGSALTFDDVPNLQRTLMMQPALAIIIAYALYTLTQFKKYKKILITVLLALYVAELGNYLHAYYVHQVVHQPYYRQEGYKELVTKIHELLPDYKKAVITTRETAPSIFFLYFGKYDPKKFQEETHGFTVDSDRVGFGKYEFSTEECPVHLDQLGKTTGEKDVLYVNFATCKTPGAATELTTIKRNDNTEVFRIITLK